MPTTPFGIPAGMGPEAEPVPDSIPPPGERLAVSEPPSVIWQIGGWRSLPTRQLTDATDLRASFSLSDFNEASCKVSLPITEAVSLGEGRSDIWIWRNGVHLGRFRVCRPTMEFGDRFEGEIVARDYRYLMKLRPTRGAFTYASPTDQATIIWDVFSNGQSWGDLGVTQAPGWAATGVQRSNVGINDGDFVWPAILTVADLDNGCEPYINPDNTLSLNYPRMGSDKGVSLDFIATEQGVMSGSVARIQRVVDMENYANAVRVFGEDGTTPVERTVANLASQPEGTWAMPVREQGLTTNDMVAAAAPKALTNHNQVFPEHRVTLRAGWWQGPDHLWLGDTVRLIVKAGEFQIDRQERIYGVRLAWDANGREAVELELSKNSTTGERRIGEALRRIRALG